MAKKLMVVVEGELPKTKGTYITNFGHLYFDGKKFLMSGMKRETPTTVDWYLEEHKNTGNEEQV